MFFWWRVVGAYAVRVPHRHGISMACISVAPCTREHARRTIIRIYINLYNFHEYGTRPVLCLYVCACARIPRVINRIYRGVCARLPSDCRWGARVRTRRRRRRFDKGIVHKFGLYCYGLWCTRAVMCVPVCQRRAVMENNDFKNAVQIVRIAGVAVLDI